MSSLDTRYSFEDTTAQGWVGSTGTTLGYHADPYCIGSYCWFANLTDGTHQYITSTYEIDEAGIYRLDAYFKRRGSHRLYSSSTDVDAYGVGNTWTQTTFDTVWYHQYTYMGLVTGTWAIGGENWGTTTSRTFDYAMLTMYAYMRTPANGLVCDGEFEAPYDANWELYDPNGDSYYASTFGYGMDYGDYDQDLGSMLIKAGDRMTTTIVVPEGAGTLSLSLGHGWNTTSNSRYYLYTEAGALVDTKLAGLCTGTWCTMTDSWGELAAGNYKLVFWGGTTPYTYVDGVTVSCSNPDVCVASGCTYTIPEAPPEETYWELDAWIYHPYAEADMWSVYQPYTTTSWYGGAYENYTIWRLRPGANVYPLATLDIVDVGVNSFGYYIDSRINAWPDVPSTTVRYEGLASVNVSAGQRINTDCALGTVGPNSSLGVYHLLLYVEYNDMPINPVPYMTRYPDGAMCSVTDSTAETTGPGAGEVADQFLAVCQTCAVPTSWTNFGRWISYLWCQMQNVVTCVLAEWVNTIVTMQINGLTQAIASADNLQSRINDVVGVNVMLLGRVVDTGAWMVQPANNSMAWLAGLSTDAMTLGTNYIEWLASSAGNLGARIDNVVSSASTATSVILQFDLEAGGGDGTNFWDVLIELIRLLHYIFSILFKLVSVIIDFVLDLFNLILMLLSGLTSSIETAEPVDLVNFALTGTTEELDEEEYEEFEVFEFEPGGGGEGEEWSFSPFLCSEPYGVVWSVDGPTKAKGVCWFIGGAILADTIAFVSLLYYLLWAFVGIIVILLFAWWLRITPKALRGLFR